MRESYFQNAIKQRILFDRALACKLWFEENIFILCCTLYWPPLRRVRKQNKNHLPNVARVNCSVLKVFSKAKVQFSVGGQHYHGRSVWYTYMPDTVLENARDVDIQLHNHVGKYVKIQLYFSNKWIMISEVKFDSGECSLHIVLTTVYACTYVYNEHRVKRFCHV